MRDTVPLMDDGVFAHRKLDPVHPQSHTDSHFSDLGLETRTADKTNDFLVNHIF